MNKYYRSYDELSSFYGLFDSQNTVLWAGSEFEWLCLKS